MTNTLAMPPSTQGSRKRLKDLIKELAAENGLFVSTVLVRRVDPVVLAAQGGVVPIESISKPVPYRRLLK